MSARNMPSAPACEADRALWQSAVDRRDDNFDRLDEIALLAVQTWQPISGQVMVLNPEAKPEQRVIRLDTQAALAAMDWLDVPVSLRAEVWGHVQLLHDVEYHGARDFPRICIDHGATLEDVLKPECWKCRLFWKPYLDDKAA